jgi:hypothetical protein
VPTRFKHKNSIGRVRGRARCPTAVDGENGVPRCVDGRARFLAARGSRVETL